MIELVDIRVFAKICELMSVSAAAEVLGMPKSTASRSLTRLEMHLGVALLYRSNRKLALTDTGLLFAEDARKILMTWKRPSRRSARFVIRRADCCV
jgi:DNA-binding transcriptional LysR family regulator